MPKCSYCGHENEEEQATCRECGTDLRAAPTGSTRWRGIFWAVVCAPAIAFALYLGWNAARPVEFDRIRIRGSGEFKGHIVAALRILKTRAPRAYEIVTNNIGVFAESKRSGMAAYERPPTSYLHDKVEWISDEAFAGVIAHESIHSKLYHDFLRKERAAVPDGVWTGEAAEKSCCDHQHQVLIEIGAPASEISYYTWNPSNRYWEIPYEKRDW